MNRHLLIALLLVGTTLSVFLQVRSFEFINYDDLDYVVDNPHVTGGLTTQNVGWAFTSGESATWQPLVWLSLMLDVQVHGLAPRGFHTTNLVLHILNTLLLYLLLVRLTGQPWPSAFAAALFAVHPLHVESVAWVTERKDVLSTLWGLLSLLAYTSYGQGGRRRHLWAACLLLALGLMAKPMLVTWPFLLLLLDYWPLERWSPAVSGQRPGPETLKDSRKSRLQRGHHAKRAANHSGRQRGRRRTDGLGWTALAIEKIPFFVLVAAASAIAFRVQAGHEAVTSLTVISLPERLANAVVSYVIYLGKTFWPVHLSVLYPHPNLPGGTPWAAWQVLGAGVILLVISALVWHWRARRYLLIGWLWYLGSLVPVIGLVQIGTHGRADRFTYVPLIGIFVMIAWAGTDLVQRWVASGQLRWARLIQVAGVMTAVLLAAAGWSQTRHWQNSITLYEHSLRGNAGGPKLHYNLGLAYSQRGEHQSALAHYRAAIGMKSDHDKAWNNLGNSLRLLGSYEKAEQAFQRALELNSAFALAHANYSLLLEQTGRLEEAIAQRQLALGLEPDDATSHNHLGTLLARNGRLEEAIVHFRQAVQLNPQDRDARWNLAQAEKLLPTSGPDRPE